MYFGKRIPCVFFEIMIRIMRNPIKPKYNSIDLFMRKILGRQMIVRINDITNSSPPFNAHALLL